jgi:hypothetical protein
MRCVRLKVELTPFLWPQRNFLLPAEKKLHFGGEANKDFLAHLFTPAITDAG